MKHVFMMILIVFLKGHKGQVTRCPQNELRLSGFLSCQFPAALITSSRVKKQIIFCEQVALKP